MKSMQFGEMNLVLGGSEIGAFKFGAGTLDFDAIYGGRRIPSNVVKGEATITPLFSIPTSLANGKQTVFFHHIRFKSSHCTADLRVAPPYLPTGK